MSGTFRAIREAVEAAARQFCICDGECFETRHGMMHGPCERDFTRARLTIAAFLRALPAEFHAKVRFDSGNEEDLFFCEDWELLASAVEAEGE